MHKPPGLYEELLTRELAALIDETELLATRVGLSEDGAVDLLSRHIEEAARRILSSYKGEPKERIRRQIEVTNRVITALFDGNGLVVDGDQVVAEVLLALQRPEDVRLGTGGIPRPGIPLRHSELIVNGPRDRRVGLEIQRELPSADRVDLLMSFVKWSGFVELQDQLEEFCRRGPLRVITTTYMGASEVEALVALEALGAEVRVSYDSRRTRLHAKAWLFHRESGFGTGIVGSSNLSHAALRSGCEWNVRLSQRDNPALLTKFRATFEQYWEDGRYEPFDPARFKESMNRRRDVGRDHLAQMIRLKPLPHQSTVLDALVAEREAGHQRNLVVAATGTGKTVMAALDYARQPGRPPLLFVAHRDSILEQSLATFRAALMDGNFGEKLTGTEKPVVGQHVFASIQSLHERRLRELDPRAYRFVVVDEFHHAAAPTYRTLLEHLSPDVLLGLTATPERTDGQSILHYFDGRVAAEMRLWDALDQDLLCPFQYFVVHDGTDLSQIDFRGGRYDVRSLETLYTADHVRAKQVLRELARRVRQPADMRALGFCVSVAHAKFMAAYFRQHDLAAAVITGETPVSERQRLLRQLEAGELCCIFAVDVLSEGVDVPLVDTVLFLRPTESPTVFLQQLGRGLRLHDDKACLTVLDFVGTAHRQFRFDRRFRAILGRGTRAELRDAVERQFPHLPAGCAITLDPRSQKDILANLKQSLTNWAQLAQDLDATMTLPVFLERAQLSLEELYRSGKSFNLLREKAGFIRRAPVGTAAGALARLLHIDDESRLLEWRQWLGSPTPPPADISSPNQRMLFAALAARGRSLHELSDFLGETWADPLLREELHALVGVLLDRRRRITPRLAGVPLHLHAHYTRADVAAALDLRGKKGGLLVTQAGVYKCDKHRCDLLFVTLDKDEREFTPTTLYEDYPISRTRFHWESQSVTRADSPTGQRYQRPPVGWRIFLFVRQRKKDARGVTSAFTFLGPVRYVSHESERPMRITWELEAPVPGEWYQEAKIAAG